jgi:hypothetical protein
MPDYRSIRGSFIRDYAEQKEHMWAVGSDLINERNKLHYALNVEFGYSEPDGSYGIGCKTHVDQGYKRRYDEIEERFRKPYDDNLPAFYDWCRSRGMTIHECLFFDNIYDDHLREIAAESLKREDWQLRPIQVKARLLVQKLKTDHSVGEIRRRLDMEIAHQHYASSRCRKFYALKPWDLGAQKAILDYCSAWTIALNFAFNGMTAA